MPKLSLERLTSLILAAALVSTASVPSFAEDHDRRVTTAAPARTGKALARMAGHALRSIQKQPQRVQNYFRHKDVSYAA